MLNEYLLNLFNFGTIVGINPTMSKHQVVEAVGSPQLVGTPTADWIYIMKYGDMQITLEHDVVKFIQLRPRLPGKVKIRNLEASIVQFDVPIDPESLLLDLNKYQIIHEVNPSLTFYDSQITYNVGKFGAFVYGVEDNEIESYAASFY